jgi:hypothetical protein
VAYLGAVQPEDGSRVYRRQIRVDRPGDGVVVGALEDTAHHVRVTLDFDDNRVRSITGEAVRLPWATCPGAAAGLAQLQGTTLTTSLAQLRSRYDPTAHCTHFFDLAQLTIAHASRGRKERVYEAVCSAVGDTTVASLTSDGQIVLEWTVRAGQIIEPARFAGVGLRQGFVRWCAARLDDDAAEEAFVLRRAASMVGVANMRLDDYALVADSGLLPGVCYTAQPENIKVAFRHVGSQRDYSGSGAGMLNGFEEARRRAASF